MKKKFTIIGLTCATLLLISCSPDDLQEENQQLKQVKTEFNENENQPIENGSHQREGDFEIDQDGNPLNPKDKG